MAFPAYILTKEVDEITHFNPVFFDTEKDAKFVGEALEKINKILFFKGYEAKVVEL